MHDTAPRNFWSRRRAAVQAEQEAQRLNEEAVAQAALQQERAAQIADKTDDEILTDLGLRDPDTMQQGDDFAAFLQSAVPEHLRRRALRRLWRSNPVLANLDGLLDFDDDFTDAATVQPGMKTAYQVGRGMLGHITALAEQAEAEARAAGAPTVADTVPPVMVSSDAPQAAEDEMLAGKTPVDDAVAIPDADVESPGTFADEDPTPNPRRHMRFAYSS